MKIDELRKLMDKSMAILVMDNGQPSFVVLNYETYRDLVFKSKNDEKEEREVAINHVQSDKPDQLVEEKVGTKISLSENEVEILERINKDIQILRDEIQKEEKSLAVD